MGRHKQGWPLSRAWVGLAGNNSHREMAEPAGHSDPSQARPSELGIGKGLERVGGDWASFCLPVTSSRNTRDLSTQHQRPSPSCEALCEDVGCKRHLLIFTYT